MSKEAVEKQKAIKECMEKRMAIRERIEKRNDQRRLGIRKREESRNRGKRKVKGIKIEYSSILIQNGGNQNGRNQPKPCPQYYERRCGTGNAE